MTTSKNNASDDAKGKATLVGFKYIKGYCIASLSNGISGIIGSSTDMPLATMLTLKGQSINYEHLGTFGDHERYSLEFAL